MSSTESYQAMSVFAPVCAIVVTFHPGPEFELGFEAIAKQVETVIVVDNGSEQPSQDMLERLVALGPHRLIRNIVNRGVATALNQGVAAAVTLGYDWAVTLDQDSIAEPGMVEEQFRVLDSYGEGPAVAIVAPNLVHVGTPSLEPRWLRPRGRASLLFERVRAPDVGRDGVTMAITSGALTNLAICTRLGRFWDELFVDFVDFEYCFRVRRGGYRILVAPKARLEHHLSEKQHRRFYAFKLTPLFHNPSRLYYIWRNRLVVMRRHALALPHWLMYELVSTPYWIFRILAVEDDRPAKIRSMIRGTMDGVRGRLGPAEEQ